MRVSFKSFGPVKRVVGRPLIELEVPKGSTVFQVIVSVIEAKGPELERLIMERNKISGSLIVLLNRRDIDTLQGPETVVNDGDEIALLPHVQGG